MQVITMATKLLWAIDKIIASLYVLYLHNQIIDIEEMFSSSLVIFALNVL